MVDGSRPIRYSLFAYLPALPKKDPSRMSTWHVILLGLIEGLTEFLPVSSTGHLLLAGHFLGFQSPGKTFEVLIQLGAILAILSVYAGKLVKLLVDFPSDARTRRFVLAVLIAFLPAAVIGATLHKYIKGYLFESPALVCTSLIVGGIVLLAVDRMRLAPRYFDVMDYPVAMALIIGFAQCLAMIPGVSRSGATIVAALLLGADKRSATEFTFFLAMPTMAGAFAYDLYKNWAILAPEDVKSIALGFVVSFIAGVVVVRYLLDFVSRHGFAPFAWWRIAIGGMGLGALAVLG
jgi:undecaprenyl-diphosphatase